MRFTDSFRPGDILKVDSETGEVYLNNQEIYKFSGSLITAPPNVTTYTYSDSETNRDLNLTLEHQERYE